MSIVHPLTHIPLPTPKRSPASAAATAKLNVGFRIAHYLLGKDAANDRQQLHESADMASGRREVDQWPVPAHNRRHEVATGVGRWTMAWYSAVGEMGHRPPAYHHKRRRSQGRAGAWVGWLAATRLRAVPHGRRPARIRITRNEREEADVWAGRNIFSWPNEHAKAKAGWKPGDLVGRRLTRLSRCELLKACGLPDPIGRGRWLPVLA